MFTVGRKSRLERDGVIIRQMKVIGRRGTHRRGCTVDERGIKGRRFAVFSAHRGAEHQKENQRGDGTGDVRDGGRPDDAVDGNSVVEEEHERNVENPFPHDGEDERAHTAFGRLEVGNDGVCPRGERRAEREDL